MGDLLSVFPAEKFLRELAVFAEKIHWAEAETNPAAEYCEPIGKTADTKVSVFNQPGHGDPKGGPL